MQLPLSYISTMMVMVESSLLLFGPEQGYEVYSKVSSQYHIVNCFIKFQYQQFVNTLNFENFIPGSNVHKLQHCNRKSITDYIQKDPRFDSRFRHTRVISGSFQINKATRPQTTIISEPQWSQSIVNPNYTYNLQYSIIITKCHHNHLTPYLKTVLRSCSILISSKWYSMSASVKNCHTASEFYGSKHLNSGKLSQTPPTLKARLRHDRSQLIHCQACDATNHLSCQKSKLLTCDGKQHDSGCYLISCYIHLCSCVPIYQGGINPWKYSTNPLLLV